MREFIARDDRWEVSVSVFTAFVIIFVFISHQYKLGDVDISSNLLVLWLIHISIYKLGHVGISSNLIGSLSLTNGQCPPPGRWIMKQ